MGVGEQVQYLSVCSGIEAASVAWKPLGWRGVAVSEIEAFPSAVLAHHHAEIPNWGDMTRFQEWPDAAIDLLVGGTPCQSFSVAGLRKGLDDPRGSLMLTYLALARRYRPDWLVWENVPGVLSADKGRAFGSLLGGLAELGYGFAYRILDAQYHRVAQRRRRVFVVGHLGDWRRAAAVLFERESLSGHPAPRRETGQGAAGTITPGAHPGGYNGQDAHNDLLIAHSLRGDGFDASEDGTGRGTPLIPIAFSVKDHGADAGELAPTLRAGGHGGSHANGGVMPAIAFAENQRGELVTGEVMGSLKVGGGKPGQGYPAIAFAINSHAGAADGDQTNRSHASGGPVGLGISAEVAYALRSGRTQSVGASLQVRRLTPRECERLQGFPDDYTLIPYRGKLAKDGPRYKALGNSMAVPVMRWIGERIAMVNALKIEAA